MTTTAGATSMSANVPTSHRERERERGQIIVIFALALVAIIAMVGLVLDGGSAFAQRRDEQSAADLAALAAANDYMLNSDSTLATARARTVAAANGYTHGTDGVVVNVTMTIDNGAEAQVDISAPHHNNFASIVGMPTWAVATTAKAQAGYPDTANGAGPIIFSIDAFSNPGGQPLAAYGDKDHPYDFGETNGDVPSGPGDIAWTNYGTVNPLDIKNLDSNEVDKIIKGETIINRTLAFGQYIGQHNNGNHTTLYDDLNDEMADTNIPVPVVDHNGRFMGWATFHVVSAVGGSDKHIKGYFVSPYVNKRLTIKACGFNGCPRYLGSPTINLVN
jgi:Flp pilus assembly protein TadG